MEAWLDEGCGTAAVCAVQSGVQGVGVKGRQEARCTPGPVLKYWSQLQNNTMWAKALRIPGKLGVQSAVQPQLVSSSRCAASSVVLDINVTP